MKIKRIKWKKIIFLLIFLIFITGFSISIFNIVKWVLDNNNTDEQMSKIYNNIDIKEIIDNENTELIGEETSKNDPYWDYIKLNLIDVDFKELKSINPSTIGWITVNGTNINYPVVQARDNKYYLTHSFDKSYNKAGWIFMDYRNDIKTINKNTIIYGHSRLDKTMFGTLKNIVKNNWYKNTDNYIIKMSTEYYNTLWQVFSVYIINTTNDYIKVSFKDNNEFKNFTQMLKERSIYNFNTNISEEDKILTLSTCYNNNKKVVMHAKLIKINKNTYTN